MMILRHRQVASRATLLTRDAVRVGAMPLGAGMIISDADRQVRGLAPPPLAASPESASLSTAGPAQLQPQPTMTEVCEQPISPSPARGGARRGETEEGY